MTMRFVPAYGEAGVLIFRLFASRVFRTAQLTPPEELPAASALTQTQILQ